MSEVIERNLEEFNIVIWRLPLLHAGGAVSGVARGIRTPWLPKNKGRDTRWSLIRQKG